MPTRDVAGTQFEVDDEGFMTNPQQWTEAIAAVLAKEEGIDPLTEAHWKVIKFMRADYQEKGQVATIRRINKVGGITTKDLYDLFPQGPAKKAARISGLSKPQGCV
jgi:dissimilatory sulfite reductase related protein